MNIRSLAKALVLVWIVSGAVSAGRAQTPVQNEILQAFDKQLISAEEAVLEQFRLVFNKRAVRGHYHTGEQAGLPDIKCLTPAYMILKEYGGTFSAAAKEEINSYRKEKALADSVVYISPSGKFSIAYDTSGTHAVSLNDQNKNGTPDYIEWVGEAADSSYRHEVGRIGFIDPIPEGYRYKIIVESLGSGLYGYTTPSGEAGAQTIFYIDNDYASGYPPNTDPSGDSKGALKVTVAHEFKHAIQYATNEWAPPSGNFSWGEMDATLMEEIVYDNVNDYYNYIKQNLVSKVPSSASIFGAPQKSTPGSYNFITWMLYYAEAYGMDLLRDAWEHIQTEPSLAPDVAISRELDDRNSNFEFSFVQNHLWHYFSGDRVQEADYGFDEREDYPNAYAEFVYLGVPESRATLSSISTLAARYLEITPTANDQGVIDMAVNMDSTQIGIGLLLYTKSGEVVEYITAGTGKPQQYLPVEEYTWEDIDRVGIVIANFSNNTPTGELKVLFGKNGSRFPIEDPDFKERPEKFVLYQNYPNPFNPETTIEFDLDNSAKVKLQVFDITGRLVQTLVNENRLFGKYIERFDASSLASGIYIYRLQVGDKVETRRMTLIK